MSIRSPLAPRARAGFISEHLESRVLLAAVTSLVKDFETTPTTGMAQTEHVPVGTGAVVLFRAGDPASGHELWRSDGANGGTSRVKDINPGPAGSAPSNLVNVNGVVYFAADDGTSGTELWRSDGTAAGTTRVADLAPGAADSFPEEITNVAGTIYFRTIEAGVPSVWTTDGTANGTRRLRQFDPDAASPPGEFRAVTGGVVFRAFETATGYELWRTDGTAAGTARLKDIMPGAGGAFPHAFHNLGTKVIFGASDGVNGFETWITDGTATGTKMVANLVPGAGNLFIHKAVALNGTLYFAGLADNSGRWDLYRTDGTAANTKLVKQFASELDQITTESRFVAHNGKVYFQSWSGDLWRSDGTEPGTTRIVNVPDYLIGARGSNIVPIGSTLYVNAMFAQGGSLFASDGAGPVDPGVAEPATGNKPDNITGITSAGGQLFIAGGQFTPDGTPVDADTVRALWRSNGTQAGTTLARNVGSGTTGLEFATFSFAALGNKLFFNRRDDGIWVTDGTDAGTYQIEVNPGGMGQTVVAGGLLYYSRTGDRMLSRTDGTPDGTFSLGVRAFDGGAVELGGKLLFNTSPANADAELWTTDGTVAGTTRLKTLAAASGGRTSSPGGIVVLNGVAYFTSQDGPAGRALWRSDGTPAGTFQVTGIPGQPIDPHVSGGKLFWRSQGSLYASDGSAAGTTLMRNFNATAANGFSDLNDMVDLNGTLLFYVDDVNGRELWRSNGTPGGTVPVTNTPDGDGLAEFRPALTVAGNLAYFVGGRGTGLNGQHELWATDGTPGGTRLVKDIYPGGPAGMAGNLTPVGNELYFLADDGQHGVEIWKSDGTPAGTTLVTDVYPGAGSPNFQTGMRAVGSVLYFAGDDGIVGRELRKLDTAAVPPPPAQPVSLRSPADAYVRDGTSSATNFGTATELVVKKASTAGSNRESYLRFDLSSVPSVGQARLRLFGRLGDTSTPSIVTTVFSAENTTWSEGGLTWNTKPVAGTTSRGTVTVSGTTGQWYEVDLTSFLQAEKAAGRDLVTLVLKNGVATSAQTIFASDEAASNRPELVVTPAGPPPQGLVVSATNVVVPEGGSAGFTVKLAVQPTADVVVNVAKAGGGDGDLSTATTALTFTSANWNVAQTVIVTAAEDADTTSGAASFTVSSDGLATKNVAASESDNDTPPPPPPAATRRAARDAYVRGGSTYGGTNFGSSTELAVRKASTTGSTRETYLNFAISDLVAADLDAVKLRLFGRSSSSTQSVPVAVHGGGTASWTESGITYNNRPASEAAVLASGTVGGTTNAWREFDVTAYVRARREAGATSVTFVVKGTSTTDAQATFASDEHATSTSRPQLAVTVKPAGPPPQGIVVSATAVVVAEGGSAGFTVKLAVQPTSDVTVTVAKSAGGDADLSTAATTLTFTSGNWDAAQTVTLNAAQDADAADGSASFALSSNGLTTRTVTATEADDDAPPAAPATLRAAADAYVRDGTSSATNFGGATELVVKRATTAGSTRESYLRFDLSGGPATVGSAKLRLFGRLGDTSSATLQTQVFAASDTTWTESGLTWDTRPATTGDALGAITVSGTTAAWYELDLTAFLQAEKAAGRTLVTLVLRNPTASSAQTVFASDEATSGRPELVVG